MQTGGTARGLPTLLFRVYVHSSRRFFSGFTVWKPPEMGTCRERTFAAKLAAVFNRGCGTRPVFFQACSRMRMDTLHKKRECPRHTYAQCSLLLLLLQTNGCSARPYFDFSILLLLIL